MLSNQVAASGRHPNIPSLHPGALQLIEGQTRGIVLVSRAPLTSLPGNGEVETFELQLKRPAITLGSVPSLQSTLL